MLFHKATVNQLLSVKLELSNKLFDIFKSYLLFIKSLKCSLRNSTKRPAK